VTFNIIHLLQAFSNVIFFVRLYSSRQDFNDTLRRAIPLRQLSFLFSPRHACPAGYIFC